MFTQVLINNFAKDFTKLIQFNSFWFTLLFHENVFLSWEGGEANCSVIVF